MAANQPLMKVKMPDGSWKTMGGTNLNATYGQIQADWGQNDPTAIDYIKNRSHYAGTKRNLTVFEKSFNFKDYKYVSEHFELNGDIYFADIFYNEMFKDVIVKTAFNGTVYDTPALGMEEWDSFYFYLGNPYLIGLSEVDNGLPFVYRYTEWNNEIQFYSQEPLTAMVAISIHHPDYPDDDMVQLEPTSIYIDYEVEEEWEDYGYWFDGLLINAQNEKFTITIDGEEHVLISQFDGQYNNFYVGDYWTDLPSEMDLPVLIISTPEYYETTIYFKTLGKHTIIVQKEEYADLQTLFETQEIEFKQALNVDGNPYLLGYSPKADITAFIPNSLPIVTFDGTDHECHVEYFDDGMFFAPKAALDQPNRYGFAEHAPFYGYVNSYDGIRSFYLTSIQANIQVDKITQDNTYENIIPLNTYTLVSDDYNYLYDYPFFLEEGVQYRIKWNDKAYICPVYAYDEYESVLGAIDYDNPDYPFAFYNWYDSYSDTVYSYFIYFAQADDVVSHTLGMKAYQSNLKCFDGKYLPAANADIRGGVKALPINNAEHSLTPVYTDTEGMLYGVAPSLSINDNYMSGETMYVYFEGPNIEVDSNGNETYVYFDEGVSNWNDLIDKPFGGMSISIPEVSFEWEGEPFTTGQSFDDILPLPAIVPGEYYITWDEEEYVCEAYYDPAPGTYCLGNGELAGLENDGDDVPFAIVVFEGQVLIFADSIGTHTIALECDTLQTINPMYIPDSIMRTEDFEEYTQQLGQNVVQLVGLVGEVVEAMHPTAAVGQVIIVKAIDENGRPTEWEATDLPSAFSGDYSDLANKPVAAAMADVSTETVSTADFNALLAALRAAGLMASE